MLPRLARYETRNCGDAPLAVPLFFFLLVLQTAVVVPCQAQLSPPPSPSTTEVSLTSLPSVDTPIDISVLRASAVVITIVASAPWNFTELVASFSDALFTVSPLSRRFGFDVSTVFPSFSVSNPSPTLTIDPALPRSLLLTAGPAPNYLPEQFRETVTITFPPRCFQVLSPVTVSPLQLSFSGVDDRTTQERVFLATTSAIAVSAIAAGSSGWIGLTGLQTFVLIMNSSCVEVYTSFYFQSSANIVSVPLTLAVNHDNATIFAASVGICIGLLLLHAMAVLVGQRCSSDMVSWRYVARKWFYPGPYLLSTAYLALSITVTAYREVVVSASSNSAFSRPALIIAWLVLCSILGVLWFDGLRRGYDGSYVLYPWSSQGVNARGLFSIGQVAQPGATADTVTSGSGNREEQQQSIAVSAFQFLGRFGKFQAFLLPKGRWVGGRGYSSLRSNCDDRSHAFPPMTLIAVAVLSAVSVNRDDCDWYFGSILLVEGIYLLLFVLMRPFSTPLLNLSWFGAKMSLLVVAALHFYWLHHAVTPNNKTAVSIRLAATAAVGLFGCFLGYNLLISAVERGVQAKEQLQRAVMSAQGRRVVVRLDDLRSKESSRMLLSAPLLGAPREGDDDAVGELLRAYEMVDLGSSAEHGRSEQRGRSLAFAGGGGEPEVTTTLHIRVTTPVAMGDDGPGDRELEEILLELDHQHGSVNNPERSWRGQASRAAQSSPSRWDYNAARAEVRGMLEAFWAPTWSANRGAAATATSSNGRSVDDYPVGTMKVHYAAEHRGRTAVPVPSFGVPPPPPLRRRCVLKIEPVPVGFSRDHIAFFVETASGPGTVLDVSFVGRAAFVGLSSLRNAQAAGTTLHGRLLFGEAIRCTVIEDAYDYVA